MVKGPPLVHPPSVRDPNAGKQRPQDLSGPRMDIEPELHPELGFTSFIESRGPHEGALDARHYHLLGKRDILGEVGGIVLESRGGGDAFFDDFHPVLEDVVAKHRTPFPLLTVRDWAGGGIDGLGGDESDFLGAGRICGNIVGFTFQRWSVSRFRSHDVVIASVVMDRRASVVIEGLAGVACTELMMLLVFGKNANDCNSELPLSCCSLS